MSGKISDNLGRASGLLKAPSAGKTIKRHYFEFATRTVGNSSDDVDQFTFTTAFTSVNGVANAFHVHAVIPIFSPGNGGIGAGLSFLETSPGSTRTDHYNKGLCYHYTSGNYQAGMVQTFVIPAGTIATGTFTITWRVQAASSNANEYCPNSTDESRIETQSVATMMITEYKN